MLSILRPLLEEPDARNRILFDQLHSANRILWMCSYSECVCRYLYTFNIYSGLVHRGVRVAVSLCHGSLWSRESSQHLERIRMDSSPSAWHSETVEVNCCQTDSNIYEVDRYVLQIIIYFCDCMAWSECRGSALSVPSSEAQLFHLFK